MHSLEETMLFFVQQAGPGTKLMSTNDLARIGVPSTLCKQKVRRQSELTLRSKEKSKTALNNFLANQAFHKKMVGNLDNHCIGRAFWSYDLR